MRQVFFGARLFDGEAMIDDGALVIEDGAIVALTPFAERPRDAESHDLGGGVLAPGLIDWQVNGGGGVLCKYEQCLAGIHAVPERVRVGGRSILLESSGMVGSSFVSVYAWAHKHAS